MKTSFQPGTRTQRFLAFAPRHKKVSPANVPGFVVK